MSPSGWLGSGRNQARWGHRVPPFSLAAHVKISFRTSQFPRRRRVLWRGGRHPTQYRPGQVRPQSQRYPHQGRYRLFLERYPPGTVKGKYVKIKYVTQLPTHTPQFAFFCNLPQYVNESYARFLENKLRERFDFSGAPVNIYFRAK